MSTTAQAAGPASPPAEVGVIVMAYGTPSTPDDVEAYYTHIRRGRPPTSDQLADLQRRYDAIGGVSPLAARTEEQRQALDHALAGLAPDRFEVVLGQKHAAPFIEDVVADLAGQGVTRTIGLVLAPHFSRASVGEYQARAAEAATAHGIEHLAIDSWHLEPAYLDFLSAAVSEALAELPQRTRVLFTAHSLPERALVDDPYPDQLADTAAAVADRLGLDREPGWGLAWQSAGATPEPWRGPDVNEVIRELATRQDVDGVLVCAQGFTSDHLEIVYDLDIESARVAAEGGLAFARTRSLNADPTVFDALARRITKVEAR